MRRFGQRIEVGAVQAPLAILDLVNETYEAIDQEDRGFANSIVLMGGRFRDVVRFVRLPGAVPRLLPALRQSLATMLAIVTTDYPLEPGEAIGFLRPAVGASLNSISVDGECSTNDAVVLLASGAATVERTPATDAELALAVQIVCADLAQQIVADGEGATLLAEIAVSGAASAPEARAIAQRIATSSLVKTALFGRDANWGRVLAAAGSAPFDGGYAQLDPARVSLSSNGTPVLVGGAPQNTEPPVDGGVCTIELDLGLGDGSAGYLTSDLSYDYVRINAEYRS